MNLDKVILTIISKDELKLWIKEAVKEHFDDQSLNGDPNIPVLLSRQEVADIYHISLVTLREWEKDGIIPTPIRKGHLVFFRKADIIDDIQKQNNGKK